MTAQEALDTIPYWQERLRLQDWTIRGKVVTQTDGNPMGKAEAIAKYKDAVLTVLEPSVIPADWLGAKDPEVTVVHEMLHLQGEGLNSLLNKKKHACYSRDYERLVEMTAIALVRFKRELVTALSEEETERRYQQQVQRDHGMYV